LTLAVDLRLRVGAGTLEVRLGSAAPVIGLAGPSGAGKSTLLRVLAGLERRAEGTVRFGAEQWQAPGRFVPAWERGVGWVPQDGVLFPHLSVRENLAYAARVPVEPIAERLGVGHLLDRRPRHLSGGERQRVALGRAMGAGPRLLLLDEPFAALDRPLRARLAREVGAWAHERGCPLLVVSHDPTDFAGLGAEVWEITAGQVARS
jgi:molybdate transport system ATP-binding protein